MINKNIVFFKLSSLCLFLFSILLLGFSIIIGHVDVMPVAITLLLVANIFLVITKIQQNIVYIMFQFTFFLFLVAGPLIYSLEGVNFFISFENSIAFKTLLSYWISAFAMWCYKIIEFDRFKFIVNKNINKIQKINQEDHYTIIKIRFISQISFYLSSIAFVLIALEKIAFRQFNTLQDYYVSYVSNLPGGLIKLSDLYLIAFAVFLATKPTKKQARIPIIIFVLISSLTVLYGVRNIIILNLLFLFIYSLLRNDDKEYWISKRGTITGIILSPFVMIILEAFDKFRRSAGFDISQIKGIFSFDLIKDFLVTQSISSNVLANSILYQDLLVGQPVPYTLGILYTYIKHNMIVRVFTDTPRYIVNSVEGALHSGNLGARLAYQLYPTTFLKGTGMGGNYIAELFTDFSILGVFMGTILICKIFNILNYSAKNASTFYFAFALVSIRWIIYIPRSSYLSWLVETFSFMNVFFILIVYFLSNVVFVGKFARKNNKSIYGDQI